MREWSAVDSEVTFSGDQTFTLKKDCSFWHKDGEHSGWLWAQDVSGRCSCWRWCEAASTLVGTWNQDQINQLSSRTLLQWENGVQLALHAW